MGDDFSIPNSGVLTEDEIDIKKPSLYKVILHNDDYTTMDFVVAILESVFNKSNLEATQIMLKVHKEGSAVCGIYPKDIAEAKVQEVLSKAKQAGYPLLCTMESE